MYTARLEVSLPVKTWWQRLSHWLAMYTATLEVSTSEDMVAGTQPLAGYVHSYARSLSTSEDIVAGTQPLAGYVHS